MLKAVTFDSFQGCANIRATIGNSLIQKKTRYEKILNKKKYISAKKKHVKKLHLPETELFHLAKDTIFSSYSFSYKGFKILIFKEC